jgi:ABC-2 type transport system permease protein
MASMRSTEETTFFPAMWLQNVTQFAPTTHFISFAQSVLYRGAGFDILWPQLAVLAAFTLVFFAISVMPFTTAIVSFQ